MDLRHQDVAAVDLLLGSGFDGFCHVTVGDGAEQHVVFTGLLLHGEATNSGEGSLEVDGFLLQGSLTLSFFGPAVLHLLHHRRGEGDSFAKGQQEVAGVTGSHFDQVSVLAQAEDVLIQNDLYTLRHGTGTKDGGGCDRPRYDVACC